MRLEVNGIHVISIFYITVLCILCGDLGVSKSYTATTAAIFFDSPRLLKLFKEILMISFPFGTVPWRDMHAYTFEKQQFYMSSVAFLLITYTLFMLRYEYTMMYYLLFSTLMIISSAISRHLYSLEYVTSSSKIDLLNHCINLCLH